MLNKMPVSDSTNKMQVMKMQICTMP